MHPVRVSKRVLSFNIWAVDHPCTARTSEVSAVECNGGFLCIRLASVDHEDRQLARPVVECGRYVQRSQRRVFSCRKRVSRPKYVERGIAAGAAVNLKGVKDGLQEQAIRIGEDGRDDVDD